MNKKEIEPSREGVSSPVPRPAKLQAEGISMRFGDLAVLEGISFSLAEGEFLCLLGPSGCGKSTLLRILSGLLLPVSGRALLDGEEITGQTSKVSYMHQRDLLLPWKTVLDNVAVPLVLKGYGWREARRKARAHLEVFGLSGFEDYYPSQLSGGMRQRAALLRTYLYRSDVMLLDEPFGALDAITRERLQEWLLGVVDRLSTSVLLVTHDVDEAILLADRILVLSPRPGRVVAAHPVPFSRPRTREHLLTTEYLSLKANILEELRTWSG
ncbi:ABC transporter ATP-binding protein [Spirochaeta thermophila]|uniref:Transporter n=1 Tax=Winmispira thermophila (strain ATCC 49972 / DSM 6192 / RI 19.B1) TaxID=665571 RepID=E0RPZ7_WINT6|nr:ABC transporter ATP-binding protein [Spirochaeta thermophila]ADN02850.1 transporter [Spirochaeta thermophila DSM 6192]